MSWFARCGCCKHKVINWYFVNLDEDLKAPRGFFIGDITIRLKGRCIGCKALFEKDPGLQYLANPELLSLVIELLSKKSKK